jgi:hypothetical protein
MPRKLKEAEQIPGISARLNLCLIKSNVTRNTQPEARGPLCSNGGKRYKKQEKNIINIHRI